MLTIDKGVKMQGAAIKGRNNYPFWQMQIGDSILVGFDPETVRRTYGAAKTSGHRWGWKFSRRNTPEGVRIWRIK